MTEKKTVAYGFWASPVSPAVMGAHTPLLDVQWDSDGRSRVWLERRSDRGVLVCQTGDDAPYDLTDMHAVRGGVGYGGGDFTVSHGFVLYVEKSGRLFRQSLTPGTPFPVTPAFGAAAAPTVSDDGQWVLYVHSCDGKDTIGLVDTTGSRWPINLVHGADFYMQPVWHPAGDRIAWIEWDHPPMPWDAGRLVVARLEGDPPVVVESFCIAGGLAAPAFQPAFSPDGNLLSYIETQDEWDRLVIVDLASGEKRTLVDGATLAEPAWVQGLRVYGWSRDSAHLFYHRSERGFGALWQVETTSGHTRRVDAGPYTWFTQIAVSPTDDAVACVAASPQIPERLIEIRPAEHRVRRCSRSELIPANALAEPRPITWTAPDGTTIHGLYYPPTHGDFQGQGLPPAIVNIHGGPTSQRFASFSGDAAFFASRGYAFLEVNYRGSSGYGRLYRDALKERWGVYDTEDAVGAARALAEQGLADPRRITVKGGSAGGYTVLNALIHHPGVFRAGICLYGVTDLFALASDTHKFEERYLDSLVGPLPATADRYRAWSPLFHADAIRDPVAVFQGKEDRVVPPRQAETLVDILRKNRVPHIFRLYEGEGHGWRKTETIVSYYNDVEQFLKQHVLGA